MKKALLFLFISFSLTIQAQLKSPTQFLPDYGQHVTYYHQLEQYYTHLVENSNYIKHQPYGETTQGRALNTYIISSPENLKNIETIRQTHLYNIGMAEKPSQLIDKAVVWLSFNVHGNEIGAAESSMQVTYNLINPQNNETKKWLENTIVIVDPCLNPDGFARYGNWLRDIAGKDTHTDYNDREHMEPWPGGRQNHYAYDLNRDWAWQTQIETQQRIAVYNQWMPMVHVDVHEMGYNDPYFFPPAAEPIHDFIAQYQKDFHKSIGENTSKKFDAEEWGYFTSERFDLFYPSYGDTYPCFNGAVGMTYEQGGINAGRAIQMSNGNILTLQDRINHHTTAVLTAVETAAMQQEKLTKNFRNYFKNSRQNPMGEYKTYVIKHDAKNKELAKLLDRSKIAYSYADETKKVNGYHYQSDSEESFSITPNDMVIYANQPKAVLTQVLFEPHQRLSDSLSYDITAWALPLAYGKESYALKSELSVKTKKEVSRKGKLEYDRAYAYYIPWGNRESVKALALLHKNQVKVRLARKPSSYPGIKIKRGDLIILKNDNSNIPSFESTMDVLLADLDDFEVLESGFSVQGADLGGEYYPLLKAPKVMLFAGEDVSVTDFGQVWYYMEQFADYPLSIVNLERLSNINLESYTTIVLPSGRYDFNERELSVIDGFISKGGKVIAIGGALNVFNAMPDYSINAMKQSFESTANQNDDGLAFEYENIERASMSSSIPGAIIENKVDVTNPLAYGLGDKYFSLKTSSTNYILPPNSSVQQVMYVPNGYKSFGFIGYKLKSRLQNTVTFATEQRDRGQVIYMADNPLFRGFWENGNLLFSNALFLVN